MTDTDTLTGSEKASIVRDYCRQTTGSEEWFSHAFGPLVYTSGIQFLAETCGAYWLIDLVASHQPDIRRKMEKHDLRPFQVWRLRWIPDVVNADGTVESVKWIIDAWSDTPEAPASDDGPASVLLAKQEIGYSDFPESLSPFEFWVEDATALLKEEH